MPLGAARARRAAPRPVDFRTHPDYQDDPARNVYWGPPSDTTGVPMRWSRAWHEWRSEPEFAPAPPVRVGGPVRVVRWLQRRPAARRPRRRGTRCRSPGRPDDPEPPLAAPAGGAA